MGGELNATDATRLLLTGPSGGSLDLERVRAMALTALQHSGLTQVAIAVLTPTDLAGGAGGGDAGVPGGGAGLPTHTALCLVGTAPLPTAEGAALARVYHGVRSACLYPVWSTAVRTMVEEADVVAGARAIGLTLSTPGPSDVGVVEDVLVDRAFHPRRHTHALELATLADLADPADGEAQVPPTRVAEALAAAALARAAGADVAAVNAALRRG